MLSRHTIALNKLRINILWRSDKCLTKGLGLKKCIQWGHESISFLVSMVLVVPVDHGRDNVQMWFTVMGSFVVQNIYLLYLGWRKVHSSPLPVGPVETPGSWLAVRHSGSTGANYLRCLTARESSLTPCCFSFCFDAPVQSQNAECRGGGRAVPEAARTVPTGACATTGRASVCVLQGSRAPSVK